MLVTDPVALGQGNRLSRATDVLLAWTLAAALIAELTVIVVSLAARSVFFISLPWSLEVSELTLIVIAFVGSAAAYRQGNQVAIHIVVDRTSPGVARVMSAGSDIVTGLFGLTLFVLSIPIFQTEVQNQTPALHLSQGIFVLPMSVGAVLLAVFALERLARQAIRDITIALLSIGVLAILIAGPASALDTWGPEAPWIAVFVTIAMLAIGVPVGFVLGAVAMAFLYASGDAPLLAVPLTIQDSLQNFILLALPFFILAGALMTFGGMSRPLANFVRAFAGHIPGGLLHVVIISMFVFSGISGSKLADIAAVGSALKEPLAEDGYEPAESVAALASGAIMGETIPPSLALLILASLTSLSVAELFLAGIVPAAVLAICLILLVYVRAKLRHESRRTAPSWRMRARTTVAATPAILVPIILTAGIVGGLGTPTEVSSLAVVYSIVIGWLVYRALSASDVWRLAGMAASMSGIFLFIYGTGSALSYAFVVGHLPDLITSLLASVGAGTAVFMVATIISMAVMGCVLEGGPAIVVFAPLLMPIAIRLGINPLQYGIVLLIAMALGYFMPPLGLGAYMGAALFQHEHRACRTTDGSVCRGPVSRPRHNCLRSLVFFGAAYPGLDEVIRIGMVDSG